MFSNESLAMKIEVNKEVTIPINNVVVKTFGGLNQNEHRLS
jgi:hypothetical protein